MLAEAKEEARVNTKLAALQKRLADAEMKWIHADKLRIKAEKKAAGMVPAAAPEINYEMNTQQKDIIEESGK